MLKDASSESSGDPQNFLRMIVFVQGLSSSEFSEDPQNVLRIFFWVKDGHPQNFLRVLRFFVFKKLVVPSIYHEDPQNFLRVDLVFLESWSSSEFSEG